MGGGAGHKGVGRRAQPTSAIALPGTITKDVSLH